MSIGHDKTRNDDTVALNPIIVREAARNWDEGDKKVNKVLRRYGVIPSMIQKYRTAAESYYQAVYE